MKIRNSSNKKIFARFNEILQIFRKYGFSYLLGQTTIKRYNPFRSSDLDDIKKGLANDIPERLRLMFQDLGTTYIKLGQLLSTRPDIVGRRIANELSKLQDNNPSVGYDEIQNTIETELHDSIPNLFKSFSKKPIATASIGQVHEGILPTGEKVAIKIQKADIEETIDTDLTIMKFIAEKADKYINSLKIYNLPGIIEEFERSIKKEIDYNQELMNMKHLAYDFKNDNTIHIPNVYPKYCSKKVITMEYIDGVKLADVFESDDPKFDKKLIADRGVKSYFKQIFINGFFHADPHPGNIFILDDNVVCFIDEGMMGLLDKEFKENLAELMILFTDNNVDNLIDQLMYMDILTEKIDIKNLKRDLNDMFSRYYGAELGQVKGAMNDLINLMTKYQVKLPNEFVLMARGIAIVEDIGQNLDPSFDVVPILQPIARKIITKKYSPKKLASSFKTNMFAFEHMIKVLPKRINKIFYKIEEGEIKINLELNNLNRITNKISLALIISALLIGSSYVMSIDKGPMIEDMPILGFIGFVVSLVLGVFTVLKYMGND
ncbi:ABC transporter [Methanobrevibacter sp. 87.7]|uniref:ABC1 kinase family protein n=1 Tax=Methanobrevibacter sp. 87.7 TaxID=387957 RepID=UPI000B511D83|nr:AarF/ABC1/UbiB kinase family protein [Methanobrevibacter sp. 87.7]OWT32896.1 ABC transporter [Methanobrevibacter sp. 87.7]